MTPMTHSLIPGIVIEVPNGAVTFWQSKGWVTASGQQPTPRPQVHQPAVFIDIRHPSLGALRARIPFATVPPVYSLLGWVAA